MSLVKPTVFFAVPRVYNRIFDRLNGQISEKPQLIQNLFRAGLKYAKRKGGNPEFYGKSRSYFSKKIIFKNSGSIGEIAISSQWSKCLKCWSSRVCQWYWIGVYEGYGLSENSAALTMNLPGKRKFGSVGKPLPNSNRNRFFRRGLRRRRSGCIWRKHHERIPQSRNKQQNADGISWSSHWRPRTFGWRRVSLHHWADQGTV